VGLSEFEKINTLPRTPEMKRIVMILTLASLAAGPPEPDVAKAQRAQAVRLHALLVAELKKPEGQRAFTPPMLILGVDEMLSLNRASQGLPPLPVRAPSMTAPQPPYLDARGKIVAPWLAPVREGAPPPPPRAAR
jgi:hypothetical protein